jgi:TnsA endonuclease N terminal/TnsA endonuclease C terminal
MPVRKIPKNHLVVTGAFASRKNAEMRGFESLLEKEFMLLLEFDSSVASFEEQPLTIPVPGIPRGYTPDFLVRYHADHVTQEEQRFELVEIKSSDDLRRNAEKYSRKFENATRFANDRGWDFRIATEKDIRTPRLANLKFLREYRNILPMPEQCNRITEIVRTPHARTSVEALLDQLGAEEYDRLNHLPTIWHMVVAGQLKVDLDSPLGNDTLLAVNEA